jgi:hypothetical protein
VIELVRYLVLGDLVAMDEEGRVVNGLAWLLEHDRALKRASRKAPKRQAKRSRTSSPRRNSTPARSTRQRKI